MSDYKPGDVVSMSRSQVVRATADTVPMVGGTSYSISLPINGSPVAFGVEADFGDTVEDVARLLAAHLENEQTIYSVAVDDLAPETFIIAGPRGVTFEATSLLNLVADVEQASVVALADDGRPMRDLVVIASENALATGTREYWTRDAPDGELVFKNRIMVREVDTGHVFEIDASQIAEVVSRAAGT